MLQRSLGHAGHTMRADVRYPRKVVNLETTEECPENQEASGGRRTGEFGTRRGALHCISSGMAIVAGRGAL